MAACFEVTCAWFPDHTCAAQVLVWFLFGLGSLWPPTSSVWWHTTLTQGSSRMGSISACPSGRGQKVFTGSKESAYTSHTQLLPYPPPAEGEGWRMQHPSIVRAGMGREQQSYLHPDNHFFCCCFVFNILKEEFRFVKCRSLFNVSRSKFILLALIYSWQFSISIWA